MKNILLCSVFFTLAFLASAQPPEGGKRGGGRGGDRPSIGILSGIIQDNFSKKGVEYATVTARSMKDSSILAGAVTNAKGEFKIEKIKIGRVYVQISFLGYEDKIIEHIFIRPNDPEKYLGKIFMDQVTTDLDGVTIKAEKPLMMTKLDKKVFDVSQLTTTTGGTANDILENLPSVQVDIDGNISLRGSSNITILIDGRPSGLAGPDQEAVLEQIPAETIETIELITNPSAKYNPENMSGIINVVLKKEKRKGFNGSVNAGLNTNPGYNGTLTLNYRTSSYNVHGSYSYRNSERLFNGESLRETSFTDSSSILDQISEKNRISKRHTIKSGVDLYLNDKNTLFLSGLLSIGDETSDDVVFTDIYTDDISNFYNSTIRNSFETEDEMGYDLTVGYKKTFIDPDKEWTTDVKYTNRKDDEIEDLFQNDYSEEGFLIPSTTLRQKTENDNIREQINIQSDYIHPLGEDSKFEMGTQIILSENDGELIFSEYDNLQDIYVQDTNISNRFIFSQDVYSAYALYGKKIREFQFQVGLRGETAQVSGNQVTSSDTFSYDYLSLFPSAHLSQKISEKQEVQFSYSRRVHRPRSRSLNPFKDFSDPNNIRVGNPELRPEFINSFELNHIVFWKKMNLTSGIYFRDIQNMMRRFRDVDSTGVATLTFVNLAGGQNIGFEFILAGKPTKWLRLSASVDLYKTILDASNLEADLNSEGTSWSNRIMASFTLPKETEFQISSMYRAPSVTAQGEFSGFLSTDVSLKRSFLKRKLSATLRMSDIFNTREYSVTSIGDNFMSDSYRKRKSQILNFSIFYRFGKQEDGKMRNKNRGGRPEGGDFDPSDME